jgi:hypothetical protein
MPNILKIGVDNATELLNAGQYDAGALIQIQSSATEAGAFADLSGTGSTPTIALVAGTFIYTGYDPAGTSTTWYRERYRNAGGTRTSDWSAAHQVAPEGSGLLCSLYDVKQRMGLDETNTGDDEQILEFIADVSVDILGYTHREFIPATGSRTFDIAYPSRGLWIPGGIRSITTLSYATTSQPDVGGSYTALAAADFHLRPLSHDRSRDWPATRIELDLYGALSQFYPGHNTVLIDGAFGWSAPPADIAGIAASAVTRRFLGKETATTAIALGPEGGVRILRDISPSEREKLDWYRWQVV